MKLIEKNVYHILFSGKECNSIDKGEKLNEAFFRELAINALKNFTD